jgi:hypothetical protein
MDSYVGKAVKFQHRVATGHSILGPSFTVESKNPLAKPDDPPSSQTVKKDFRHFKPVPTALVVDDAIVLLEHRAPGEEEPRVMLIHGNGIPVMGADWHNAVSVAHDIPHHSHDGAEEGERFWFDPNEDLASYVDGSEKRSTAQSERIRDLTLENGLLKAQLAETTEGKDAALQAIADQMGIKISGGPLSTQPGPTLISSATGSSAEPPMSQGEAQSYQDAQQADGKQDREPVSGVADQVQGQQADAANAAPQVAGDAPQVNEAPSPEQPAQSQAPADDSAPSAPSGSD